MDKTLLEGLTEEQKDRYNQIKDLSLRLFPQVANDKVQMELSHYLWKYFAIHNKLPEPMEKGEKEEIIRDYKTPADIENSLNKISEEIENVIIN